MTDFAFGGKCGPPSGAPGFPAWTGAAAAIARWTASWKRAPTMRATRAEGEPASSPPSWAGCTFDLLIGRLIFHHYALRVASRHHHRPLAGVVAENPDIRQRPVELHEV